MAEPSSCDQYDHFMWDGCYYKFRELMRTGQINNSTLKKKSMWIQMAKRQSKGMQKSYYFQNPCNAIKTTEVVP